MGIDPSRFRTPPFAHQVAGVEALVEHAEFALFDEMGAGKSKQVVDAACALAERGVIDTVVVVAPASVRCVWMDFEIGEIRKHAWVSSSVCEFALGKSKIVWSDDRAGLLWMITNYEILRGENHLDWVKRFTNFRKVLLVLDESSYVKNRTAQQTKAVIELRRYCARCVLLNGTPVTQSPLDLFSQMRILDPKILNFANFYAFRARYCELQTQYLGHRSFKTVVGYKNLDDLTQRVAPYCLRREKRDCLDLPEKLYTVREIQLTAESWRRYQQLRREAVVALDGNLQLEPNAAVRIMRLAQLTSGILGGGEVHLDQLEEFIGKRIVIDEKQFLSGQQDISDEKLSWCVKYLTEESTARAIIVWCRWRRERERLVRELRESKAQLVIRELYGGQKALERTLAVQAFSSSELSSERKVLVAQPHAGGHGLNLVAASECVYLSNDFSWGIRVQSEDRAHRPGQRNAVLYTDVLATGPKGEKSIDHAILKALREKEDVARWTTARWRKELGDE